MKTFGYILFGTTALAVSVIGLRAQSQLAEFDAKFKSFDKNGDGIISGSEMDGATYLRALDADKNGTLTRSEALQSVRKAKGLTSTADDPSALFKRLDKNADNKLTADELPGKKWLAKLDANQDGGVTLKEATEALASLRKQPPSSDQATEDRTLKEAPEILKAGDYGVGRMVADTPLKAMDGKALSLKAATEKNGLAIAFFSATCPISRKLAPALARLEQDLKAKEIGLLLVNAPPGQKADAITQFIEQNSLKSRVVLDADAHLAQALLAQTTTEVFLLDATRTLVYRGALNDQYGLGYAKERPTHHYLQEAVTAMLRGTPAEIAATSAPGCALDLPAPAKTPTTVTYHRDIARILQANCVECHREGGVAPFALDSHDAVIEHAGMIRKQVERDAMPPWFAAPLPGATHSPWANDRSLSERDRTDLLTWLASDRPKGDAAEAPKPRHFPSEWNIGKPDAIIAAAEPISVKAEGTMPYQHVNVATNFPEDRWVRGYEILPTAREVVHHVIVSVHEKGREARDNGDEGSEGYWAAYVPGNTKQIYPEGFARKLPAGATVRFQIHYTPNGKAVQDTMRIGLLFAKEPPKYVVHTSALPNPRIRIPAGAPQHVETAQRKLPVGVNAMALMAHMHVRGKAFKFEAISPDGTTETLLDIPRYDFNWQLRYDYAQPRYLPRGTTIKITAVYDNSAANPANPDPTKAIRWGQQTSDEMMIGYLEHYTPLHTITGDGE